MSQLPLKAVLRGSVLLTVALDHPMPSVVEFLAAEPLVDAITVDLEHANVGDDRVEEVIRVASLCGLSTIVRVPLKEAPRAQRLLDAGAVGWKVPDVQSPEEASRAVAQALHSPDGERGIGRTRSNHFGRDDLTEAAQSINRQTMILAMIESSAGVAAAEGIAAVQGVEVLVVGLVDLSAALGGAAETDLMSAVDMVASAAARHGKALGLAAGSAAVAARNIDSGARLLTVPLNSLISSALRNFGPVLGRS